MPHFHKVNATYHAPKNDSKVTAFYGTTCFDGVPVDLILTQAQHASRLRTTPFFQVNSIDGLRIPAIYHRRRPEAQRANVTSAAEAHDKNEPKAVTKR